MVAFVVAAWVGMKALSSWWWVFRVGEYSDTYYYFLAARDAAAALASPHAGSWAMTLSQAMPEYPTPAAWLLLAPYLLGADDPTSYRGAIMLITTLADAVFAVVLGRALGPIAVLSWVMLTTALGGLPLLRLDMLPAVAAGVALVLVVQRRGGRAGVAIAVGTALKVWPIIVAPLLFAGRARLRAFVSLAVSGIVLVVLSVTAGGWERLLSPLTYQGDRGLQIEAVAALDAMWRWGRRQGTHIFYSEFHAYEIGGPGVPEALLAARIAAVVAVVACVVLVLRWLRAGTPTRPLGWISLTLIGAFIVTSPALSPQYLLWLAPSAAVLVGQASRDGGDAPPWRPALATLVLLALLCVLTTVIYPVAYDALLVITGATPAALVVLAARNIGLVVLTMASGVAAWVVTGGNQRKRPWQLGIRA